MNIKFAEFYHKNLQIIEEVLDQILIHPINRKTIKIIKIIKKCNYNIEIIKLY